MKVTDTPHTPFEKQQIDTAIHEAGHAIVGALRARPPTKIDIVQDNYGNVGHTDFPKDVPDSMRRYFDDSDEKKSYLKTRVLTALGGSVAQDIFDPNRTHDRGDNNDYKQAETYLKDHMSWDENHKEYLTECVAEAKQMLTGNWNIVQDLANELLAKLKLSETELQSILGDMSKAKKSAAIW